MKHAHQHKSDVAEFVEHGCAHMTPHTLEKLLHQLPLLKAEFTQIDEPKLPHLVDQLEFLADVIEDVAEGAYKHLPYGALAGALFAVTYAHQAVDIIPDSLKNFGHVDDSVIVRYVLMKYSRDFAIYAATRKIDWDTITTAP